ncbi:3-hydroxyisobutyrate dehydrogenase, mitochondrial [Homalodisca vitripennis]|uniref:3-hydroxyisobutyrate dehydrogenase, mitochondrial n=1 Tax=Homalodisca vitripennis TaxID=197043 RepID=UPI001EEB5FDD|nr:3-hydroxyisobutyrate dehydrogenase, mitochondrial [Homalodisca vitripennis]
MMFAHSTFCKNHVFKQFKKVVYLKLLRNCYGTHNISTIGFIGLGAMGSRMARNLLKQFKDVYVFDINSSATASLAKEGASVAKNLDEFSKMDCIISMLPANQHVLDVYQGPNGLISKVGADTLLIDSSTVDPEVPQQLATIAQQRNITFVDAPVSGGINAAAAAQLTFMVGGSPEGAKRAEPVLQAMGKKIVHCGDSGSGQIAKICNNMLLGISMVATAEAMNLGVRLGMDPKLLASVINSSSGRCWSSDTYNPVPGVMDSVPASNNYQGGFMSHLIVKDLSLAHAVAQRSGSSTPFGKQALDIYKMVCEQGKADLDFSVVYQYIKELQNK